MRQPATENRTLGEVVLRTGCQLGAIRQRASFPDKGEAFFDITANTL